MYIYQIAAMIEAHRSKHDHHWLIDENNHDRESSQPFVILKGFATQIKFLKGGNTKVQMSVLSDLMNSRRTMSFIFNKNERSGSPR